MTYSDFRQLYRALTLSLLAALFDQILIPEDMFHIVMMDSIFHLDHMACLAGEIGSDRKWLTGILHRLHDIPVLTERIICRL